MSRVFNFSAGPAALPLAVLEQLRDEMLDWHAQGMSVMEMSHRGKAYVGIAQQAEADLRELLSVPANYKVLFLQGGATAQFAAIPLNLSAPGAVVDYVNTGTWSTNAIKEARVLNKPIKVVASSEDRQFTYIPASIAFNKDAVYAHITSNNTIRGTQWSRFPDTGGVPLVADMSSDFMSRPFDAGPFGLVYAGAQKNIGPAGVTLVIVRDDMLGRVPEGLPVMLKYTTFSSKNSLYNTPPCFAIYAVQLVLKWIEETVGGLDKMAALNRAKADRLYGCIDASGGFYRGTAEPASRSQMNVTFRLAGEELEKRFLEEAARNGLSSLKGHRSVGGCRASIYNAVGLEAVEALAEFMNAFAKRNG